MANMTAVPGSGVELMYYLGERPQYHQDHGLLPVRRVKCLSVGIRTTEGSGFPPGPDLARLLELSGSDLE